MRNAIVFTLVVVAACRADDRSTPPASDTHVQPARPALVHADAATLATDIDDAQRLGTWQETQRKWQGQHVAWDVVRYGALCRSAEACNVAAFSIQRGAKSGWMPKLAFAPGQWTALEAACKGHDPCELAIEGTLDNLALTGETPTNVHIADARVTPRTRTAQR
jgi:hypothetical protein